MRFGILPLLENRIAALRESRFALFAGPEKFFLEKLLSEIFRVSGYPIKHIEPGNFYAVVEPLVNLGGLFDSPEVYVLNVDECPKVAESPSKLRDFLEGDWKRQRNILILHSDQEELPAFEWCANSPVLVRASRLVEYRGDFYQWIKEWLLYRGVTLSDEVLKTFVNLSPRDLSLLDREMEKLCLYPGNLGFKEVRSLSAGLREQTFAGFLNLINVASALPALEKLKYLRRAYSDCAIIGVLSQHLIRIMAVSQKSKSGLDNAVISQELNMGGYQVRTFKAASFRYPIPKLVKCLETLALLDERAASTGSVGTSLDLFILNLCDTLK